MLQGRLLLFEWSLPLLPVITLLLVRLILDLRNHLIMMMVVITLMAVPGSPLVRVGLLDVHRLVPLQLHTIVVPLAQAIMLPFAIAIMARNASIMFRLPTYLRQLSWLLAHVAPCSLSACATTGGLSG